MLALIHIKTYNSHESTVKTATDKNLRKNPLATSIYSENPNWDYPSLLRPFLLQENRPLQPLGRDGRQTQPRRNSLEEVAGTVHHAPPQHV